MSLAWLDALAWSSLWLAAVGFRPTERYGGLVVDGALLAGAALALWLAGG